jgi:salicylate 5-hydroxylase large subunit
VLPYFDRVFNGRKLKMLGYNRQRIPGNWKLMQENIKDPYHPGLLHTWFVTFGLWRADQKSRMVMDRAPPPRLMAPAAQRRRAAR